MKFVILTASFCLLLFNSFCQVPASSNVQQSRPDTSNERSLVNFDLPLILISNISIRDNSEVQAGPVVPTQEILADDRVDESVKAPAYPPFEKGLKLKADILNCAGYLTTGTLIKTGEDGWTLELPSDLERNTFSQKIRTCDPAKIDNYASSDVFVVVPSNSKRANAGIIKNQKDLFASLPESAKKWANKKINLKGPFREKQTGDPEGRKINEFLDSDAFADLDADGKIDLVSISGQCANPEYSCSILLYFHNGKWSQIGYIKPA